MRMNLGRGVIELSITVLRVVVDLVFFPQKRKEILRFLPTILIPHQG